MNNIKTPDEIRFEESTFCYMEQLYRLACSKIGNSEDAEDAIQETYLKAYRAFDTVRERINIKAWLTQILINTLHDYHRKRLRIVKTVDISDLEEDCIDEPRQKSSEDQICHDEIDPALISALRALPDKLLIPILLREIHENSYQEIAEILEVPVGTIMSRLFRARALLRRALSEAQSTDSGSDLSIENKIKPLRGSSK